MIPRQIQCKKKIPKNAKTDKNRFVIHRRLLPYNENCYFHSWTHDYYAIRNGKATEVIVTIVGVFRVQYPLFYTNYQKKKVALLTQWALNAPCAAFTSIFHESIQSFGLSHSNGNIFAHFTRECLAQCLLLVLLIFSIVMPFSIIIITFHYDFDVNFFAFVSPFEWCFCWCHWIWFIEIQKSPLPWFTDARI